MLLTLRSYEDLKFQDRASFARTTRRHCGCSHRRSCRPLTGRSPLSPPGLRQCPMMKLSSDNGSITSRRAAARRPPSPPLLCPEPRRVALAQVERRGGRNGHRRTVYLPWRLFMLADGHLCCTHIALRSRSRGLAARYLARGLNNVG